VGYTLNKGFTFLEVIIVVAILLVLTGTVMPMYVGIINDRSLAEVEDQIILILRLARGRSDAGLSDSAHGVYVDNDVLPHSLVLFEGGSYLSRNPAQDYVVEFGEEFSLTTNFAGGDVVFSRVLARADEEGEIVATHIGGEQEIIQINKLGQIR